MKRGRYAQYGFRFRGGKKEFYIKKGYQVGWFCLWAEDISLTLDQAERIAELIQEAKVLEKKPE